MLAGKVGSFGEEGGVGGGYVYSGKKGWELADKGYFGKEEKGGSAGSGDCVGANKDSC
ncbi:hypothetical protein HPP92_011423 [Vanilla planifolia]|uniref:Uncharacterized protein n=1 Tax=Vanilla planifolia TaxID=51239 RepID=A0A835V103_VANPL|nr:hypothetical protein HPP92_011685 [Vanilla planifolia]KAG0483339.1 hypothetical protein HPP92_011423 [Vanilla planifolia]